MKIVRPNRCEKCKFAEKEGGMSKNYTCHFGPPTLSFVTSNKSPIPLTAFPVVQPDQWCNQFGKRIIG